MAGITAQNVPLLNESDSDSDVETGRLPTYAQVESGVGLKFLMGNNGQPRDGKESVALTDVNVRMGFLRKVLGILSFQFLITVILCGAVYLNPTIRGFVQHQPWIMLTLSFSSIGVLFAMFYHAHNVPVNYGLLALWTIMQALTVSAIVTFYAAEVVLQAMVVTAAVVFSLFLYTLQSKHDFRKGYALMATVSMVFLVGCMLQILLMSTSFNFFMSIFGAILFSVYLVFDIDAVMHHHSEEDYILACISIYMDVINLFINILQIINEANKN